MLVKIHLGGVTLAARPRTLCKTIGDVLTKTITDFTSPTHVLATGGAGIPEMSWFHPQGLPFTAWTLVSDNTSGTTGSYVVRKPSTLNGKTLYLSITYTTTTVSFNVSNTENFTISAGTVAGNYDLTTASYATYLNEGGGQGTGYYLAILDNSVTLLCQTIVTTVSTYPLGSYTVSAFEWAGNPYDGDSQESGMRLFSSYIAQNSLSTTDCFYKTANMYYPATDSYSGNVVTLSKSNLLISSGSYAFSGVGGTIRDENLIDNLFPLVPIVFADYATGYLPVNVSQATGVYATSHTGTAYRGGEIVVVGGQNYMLAKLCDSVAYNYGLLCRF